MSRYSVLQISLIIADLLMCAIVLSPRRSPLTLQMFFWINGALFGNSICKILCYWNQVSK